MSTARQQHEVPRFYLEYFACKHSGRVEVYDIQQKKGYADLPENVGTMRDTYSFTREDGTKDHGVDEMFQSIESKAAGAVYEKVLSLQPLSQDERIAFAHFLGCMFIRSPFHRATYATMSGQLMSAMAFAWADNDDTWSTLVDEMKAKGSYTPEVAERVRQMFLKQDIRLDYAQEATLPVVGHMPNAIEAFYDMKWSFVRAARGSFITSDSPVTIGALPELQTGRHRGVGLRSPHALVTFPLSSSLCLIGHWTKFIPPLVKSSAAIVKECNGRRMLYAYRRLYSEPLSHNLAGLAARRPENVSTSVMHAFGREMKPDVRMVRKLKKSGKRG